jgi:preprotein translocase subunit SecG
LDFLRYFLILLDTALGIGLLILIFLHSGKDAGLSSALGGGMSSIGGTSVVQKNLDRLTVGFAIAFFGLTIGLGFIL